MLYLSPMKETFHKEYISWYELPPAAFVAFSSRLAFANTDSGCLMPPEVGIAGLELVAVFWDHCYVNNMVLELSCSTVDTWRLQLGRLVVCRILKLSPCHKHIATCVDHHVVNLTSRARPSKWKAACCNTSAGVQRSTFLKMMLQTAVSMNHPQGLTLLSADGPCIQQPSLNPWSCFYLIGYRETPPLITVGCLC